MCLKRHNRSEWDIKRELYDFFSGSYAMYVVVKWELLIKGDHSKLAEMKPV